MQTNKHVNRNNKNQNTHSPVIEGYLKKNIARIGKKNKKKHFTTFVKEHLEINKITKSEVDTHI